MSPEIHLIIHNIGFSVTTVIALGLGLFAFINNPKKTANITIALAMLNVAIFLVSQIFGVSTSDPVLSREILMCNICVIFITIFHVHCILALIGKDKERKSMLFFIYITGIALAIFYLINPDNFLHISEPRMYFPNYYVPGPYDWVMRVIYNGILPFYMFVELFSAYLKANNKIEKNRFYYFFFAGVVGYIIGIAPVFLIYGIPLDPFWGSLMGLYGIPFVYSVVYYELFDVKVIAKRAFFFAIAVATTGVFISIFNFLNQWLVQSYPVFPFWISPFVSSIVIVSIAVFVWVELRKGDLLKSEFITTVTHKFRTPLTGIKWATESLNKSNLSEDDKTQLNFIMDANAKLVDLTNILVSVSESEESFNYKKEKLDLSYFVEEIINSFEKQKKIKNISFNTNITNQILAIFDKERVKFVIQVFIENAILFSSKGGVIDLSLYIERNKVVFKVKDSGIGISKKELPFIFSKFYRGDNARREDTEGMGIGLFLSKRIILNHGGKIWVSSDGEGKGSTFYFTLPIQRG